jgi:ABC-type multidrug transport system ATPase subunit
MFIADSISKTFRNRKVLSSARIEARAGEVVGLLGRMGTGKSTLLNVCAGRTHSDSGWIELNGIRAVRWSSAQLSKNGLFYLKEGDNLAWTRTVGEHLDEIARRFGEYDKDHIVRRFHITDFLGTRINRLSGGETRRVEMALAFARRPVVLLFDELLRGADPKLCETLGRGIRELAAAGTAVVVTGHEVTMLMGFLDSVVFMTSGTTYHLGSPSAAKRNEMFAREYLGTGGVAAGG